jgi:hypothetical protein
MVRVAISFDSEHQLPIAKVVVLCHDLVRRPHRHQMHIVDQPCQSDPVAPNFCCTLSLQVNDRLLM